MSLKFWCEVVGNFIACNYLKQYRDDDCNLISFRYTGTYNPTFFKFNVKIHVDILEFQSILS